MKICFCAGFTRLICLACRNKCVKTNEDNAILSATEMFASNFSPLIHAQVGPNKLQHII